MSEDIYNSFYERKCITIFFSHKRVSLLFRTNTLVFNGSIRSFKGA